MKKKVAAVLLAGVMINSMALTGCLGGRQETADTSREESKNGTENGAENETETDADQRAADETAALIDAINELE